MKNISLLLVLFTFLVSFAPKLKSVQLSKEIKISLPSEFMVMPDDQIANKYPAARKPLAAYTSPNGQIDFVANERTSTFKAEDLKMLKDVYQASITNKYSEVTFIKNEITKINNQNYIVFEFTSAVRDEERQTKKLAPIRRYTLLQYTIVKDKLYIFTFNVPIDLKESWQQTARKIMSSIKIS